MNLVTTQALTLAYREVDMGPGEFLLRLPVAIETQAGRSIGRERLEPGGMGSMTSGAQTGLDRSMDCGLAQHLLLVFMTSEAELVSLRYELHPSLLIPGMAGVATPVREGLVAVFAK